MTGRLEEDDPTLVSLCPIKIAPIKYDILKKVEGRKIKGNRNMTSGVGNKKQNLSCQSKWLSSSGAGKSLSIFHPKIDKG